jgi:hypothetical protein
LLELIVVELIVQVLALLISVIGSGLLLFRKLGANEANIQMLQERMNRHESSMDNRILAVERDMESTLEQIREDLRELRQDIKELLRQGVN